MKCRHTRKSIVEAGAADLPGIVRRHLSACEDCRRFAEADGRVLRWLAHGCAATPEPGFDRRLIAGVWAEVDGAGATADARGDWFPLPMPVLRFGMAALFIGMIAFQFLADGPATVPPFAADSRRAPAMAPAFGLAPVDFPADGPAEGSTYGLRLPPDTNLPALHWPAPTGRFRAVSQ